jgi:hypothetical protein
MPESLFTGMCLVNQILSVHQINLDSYVPSFALCILAIVLFAFVAIAHIAQTFKYRAWYFLPLSFGCIMEVVGYIARSMSAHKDPYNIIYFVLNYFFIVTAPVFITASIYVCLNKLISWARSMGFDEKRRRWLAPKAILWAFVTCDVISTGMQVAGAALIGHAESDRKDPTTPNNILLAGLAFQSFAFLVFLIVFTVVVGSLRRDRNLGSSLERKKTFLVALGVASLLIFLRIIFRLAETAQGVFGYLMVHEAFFGSLEFAPVILALLIMAVFHPGRWIP